MEANFNDIYSEQTVIEVVEDIVFDLADDELGYSDYSGMFDEDGLFNHKGEVFEHALTSKLMDQGPYDTYDQCLRQALLFLEEGIEC